MVNLFIIIPPKRFSNILFYLYSILVAVLIFRIEILTLKGNSVEKL